MKKDWRERELTMEVIVGAFVVMVFLGLGYFTIILSKEAWFSEKSEMRVTFSNVMGLRDGDPVVVRGMPIGKVKALELTKKADGSCQGVCVTLLLDEPVEMHDGYQIKIVSTSILGGRQLQVDQGPINNPVVTPDLFVGKTPHDIMEDAADIVNAAREDIVKGAVFAKLRSVADQLNEMVTRVNSGHGILGKILSEKDTLYGDLEASVASLRNIISRVESGEGTAGRLFSKDAQLYDDLEAAVASLKRISEQIEKGEGTAGRIVTDDSLYQELEATVGEVRAAIDDFRETAPVTTFSSIFFGAF